MVTDSGSTPAGRPDRDPAPDGEPSPDSDADAAPGTSPADTPPVADTSPDPEPADPAAARPEWEPAVLALAASLRGDGGEQWKPGEEEMRRRELRQSRRSLTYNRITAVSAALAAVAAAAAAGIGGWAVKVAQDGNERQTVEARFSDSIRSIGSDTPTERIAGFIMLRRNVEQRLRHADQDGDPSETVLLYGTAVEVLASYLKSVPRQPDPPAAAVPAAPTVDPAVVDPAADGLGAADVPVAPPTPAAPAPGPATPGQPTPPSPTERQYAAKQLANLLGPTNRRLVLRYATLPLGISVDLASADLHGTQMAGVDFSWLSGKYFAAVDLRAATLTRSRWGDAFLGGALLQCANLGDARLNDDDEGAPKELAEIIGADLNQAHLEGANLAGADLRKANLVGAHLDGADITGARLDGADLTGAHLDGVLGRDASGLVVPAGGPTDGRRYNKIACGRSARIPGFGG